MSFEYRGPVAPSKSEMIRALALKSWNSEIKISNEAVQSLIAEDIGNAEKCFAGVVQRLKTFDTGESALTLRLLMARLSRLHGEFKICGNKRLFERPHQELCRLLITLGAKIEWFSEHVIISSQGWIIPEAGLEIDGSQSSQFASALFINSWDLPAPLKVVIHSQVSEGYFELTLKTLETLGFSYERSISPTGSIFLIEPRQKIPSSIISVAADMSTAFTIASWATLGGLCEISNIPIASLQPDYVFLEIFRAMNVNLEYYSEILKVSKTEKLSPIHWNLKNSPDLWPVLSVLCGLAEGRSILTGASQLKWKESNRLAKSQELLIHMNRAFEVIDDGILIDGRPFSNLDAETQFTFNPDQDHRWVMAAHAAKLAGFKINIENPEVINKTAPQLFPFINNFPGNNSLFSKQENVK